MKCNNCDNEILAKFTHALQANSCPFCGGAIMDETLQKILSTLKDVFDEAGAYMPQIEDWLFSNFQFKRISENEVVINKEKFNQTETFNFPVPGGGLGRGNSVKRSGEGGGTSNTPPQTIFAQRAAKLGGVDFQKDIEYIKGNSNSISDLDVEENIGNASFDDSNIPKVPLAGREKAQLSDIFGPPDPVLELEKVKRIQRQDMSSFAGNSKLRRNED
jgi:Zn-finger nucleic acid-binding protein